MDMYTDIITISWPLQLRETIKNDVLLQYLFILNNIYFVSARRDTVKKITFIQCISAYITIPV